MTAPYDEPDGLPHGWGRSLLVHLGSTLDIALEFRGAGVGLSLAEVENAIKVRLQLAEAERQRTFDDHTCISDFLPQEGGNVLGEPRFIGRNGSRKRLSAGRQKQHGEGGTKEHADRGDV